jgi:hypothetical protein
MPVGNGDSFGLKLRAAYVYDAATNPVLAANLVSLPGASFAVAGAMPARASALLASAVEYHIGGSGTFFAKFKGEIAENAQNYEGSLGFRVNW